MASISNSILSVQQQYIPLFDGKNYDFWCVKMKTTLLSLDLWELVEKGYVEPNSSTTLAGAQQSQLKMQQQKNASALSKIQQAVSDSIFPIIMRATTAKEAWDILQQQFQGNLKEMDLAKAASSDLVPTQEVAIEEEDLPSGSQQCSSQDQGTRPEKGKENSAGTRPKKGKEKIAGIGGTKPRKEKEKISGTGPKKGKDDISGMEEEEWIKYLPLYKAVDSGNWKAAEQILNSNPKALTARLSRNGTALHIATLAGHVKIVKELVKKMKAEDLVVLRSKYYNTALHDACSGRIKEIAKILVEANPVLLSTKGWIGRIPVVEAAFNGDKDMVHYLYSKTPKEALNPDTRKMLLRACINADIYDTAFDLVSNSETLAASVDTGAALALNALAQKASAFPSGSQLLFWQWWIYSIICIEPLHASTNIVGDIESSHKGPSDRGIVIIRVLNQLIGCCGISSKLFATVPAIKHIYDEKVKHVQARKLLVHICEKISDRDPLQFISKEVYEAIVEATKNGIAEFIFEIVKLYPDIIWKSDNDGRIIFNYAILRRQEKIFSLLHVMGSKKNILAKKKDKDKNNMLHHAAILLHASSQLGRISGAALQMQRELQWFREVENIVQPEYKNMVNKENLTPRALFTKQHKELVEGGETWMKDTATSYTVVAALIATIMFAAAFTVPGGSNGDTGIPIYLHDTSFLIFIISDVLSLVSSSISLLMFLGILTSRYEEEDFLVSLPRKLIIGLSTLFFSILTMMITFSAALVIALRTRLSWIPYPVILVAVIPAVLFIILQAPLLVDIFRSTCGCGIFQPPKIY